MQTQRKSGCVETLLNFESLLAPSPMENINWVLFIMLQEASHSKVINHAMANGHVLSQDPEHPTKGFAAETRSLPPRPLAAAPITWRNRLACSLSIRRKWADPTFSTACPNTVCVSPQYLNCETTTPLCNQLGRFLADLAEFFCADFRGLSAKESQEFIDKLAAGELTLSTPISTRKLSKKLDQKSPPPLPLCRSFDHLKEWTGMLASASEDSGQKRQRSAQAAQIPYQDRPLRSLAFPQLTTSYLVLAQQRMNLSMNNTVELMQPVHMRV